MGLLRGFGILPWTLTGAGLLVVAVYVYVLAGSSYATEWDTWLALLLAPALVLAAVPLGRKLAVVSGDPMLVPIVVLAAVGKLVGTGVRYLFVFDVYGRGDSVSYARAGAVYAEQLWNGYLTLPPGDLVGTRFIELVTGLVFTVTRPATLTGFLVFSFAGFVGLYHFARAFNIALPHARLRTYSLLLFFLPSLLFWPSSIGKESWMMFTLGLAARGTALILARQRGGLLYLAIGVAGAAMVRPHIALLVCVALAGARLLSDAEGSRSASKGQKLLTLVIVVAIGAAILGQVETYFNVEEEGSPAGAADAVLTEANRRTGQGGSEFQNQRVTSPLQLPAATVSILFRPFPHEAGNLQGLVASVEGVFLMGACVVFRRSLRRIPAALRSQPYVLFVVLYSLMFIVAFSSFGNFGILTRQRVQLFPFILTLLAIGVHQVRVGAASGALNRRRALLRADG